jgi:hypothetical protein
MREEREEKEDRHEGRTEGGEQSWKWKWSAARVTCNGPAATVSFSLTMGMTSRSSSACKQGLTLVPISAQLELTLPLSA